MEERALNKMYTDIKNCRVCNSANIKPLIHLGKMPLANSLKKRPDEAEAKYPLTLVFCPRCSSVQLKETVKKEILFDNYVWLTGTSETTRRYAEIFCSRTDRLIRIKPSDLILEIASNDGTFLRPFMKKGHRVLGVEPARNIARLSVKTGIDTVNQYWSSKTAEKLMRTHGKAKVIIARNVIPHVSELHDVINGIGLCMADEGIGVIEFHYAGKILQDLHYDSIYHEHLCYFSIKSMEYLLKRFGLFPFHIDLSHISGGSCVIYFSKKKRWKSTGYNRLADREKRLAVNTLTSWREFSDRCVDHRESSRQILESYADKTVVGFGASARSSTYLNFCRFNDSEIKAIIDNNRLKQGLYSAGTSAPIVSIEDGLRMKPDLLFILAWNFKDEILEQCRDKGYRGDFLTPFPKTPYILKAK